MKPHRISPNHEATSITVKAGSISKPKKIYRNAKHNGNRIEVKDEVEIKVNKQISEKNIDRDYRPEPGTILRGEDTDKISIEAKRIEKQGRHKGMDVATASSDVRIFGNLRRRK